MGTMLQIILVFVLYIYIYILDIFECAWNCETCSDPTTCVICKSGIIGLETAIPCGCNNTAGYAELIPESCSLCPSDTFAQRKACLRK